MRLSQGAVPSPGATSSIPAGGSVPHLPRHPAVQAVRRLSFGMKCLDDVAQLGDPAARVVGPGRAQPIGLERRPEDGGRPGSRCAARLHVGRRIARQENTVDGNPERLRGEVNALGVRLRPAHVVAGDEALDPLPETQLDQREPRGVSPFPVKTPTLQPRARASSMASAIPSTTFTFRPSSRS